MTTKHLIVLSKTECGKLSRYVVHIANSPYYNNGEVRPSLCLRCALKRGGLKLYREVKEARKMLGL